MNRGNDEEEEGLQQEEEMETENAKIGTAVAASTVGSHRWQPPLLLLMLW